MMPDDPNYAIAPRRTKPSSPDPYPRNDSSEAQRKAVEALAKVQASRPMKPPGVKR